MNARTTGSIEWSWCNYNYSKSHTIKCPLQKFCSTAHISTSSVVYKYTKYSDHCNRFNDLYPWQFLAILNNTLDTFMKHRTHYFKLRSVPHSCFPLELLNETKIRITKLYNRRDSIMHNTIAGFLHSEGLISGTVEFFFLHILVLDKTFE